MSSQKPGHFQAKFSRQYKESETQKSLIFKFLQRKNFPENSVVCDRKQTLRYKQLKSFIVPTQSMASSWIYLTVDRLQTHKKSLKKLDFQSPLADKST